MTRKTPLFNRAELFDIETGKTILYDVYLNDAILRDQIIKAARNRSFKSSDGALTVQVRALKPPKETR